MTSLTPNGCHGIPSICQLCYNAIEGLTSCVGRAVAEAAPMRPEPSAQCVSAWPRHGFERPEKAWRVHLGVEFVHV